MKRKQCLKNEEGQTLMTSENIKICLENQEESFQTLELNESLHLQYYGFANIGNLTPFTQLHTLFLNNNAIAEISNLQHLTRLTTLNLSYNSIKEVKNLKLLSQLYTLDLSNNQIQEVLEEELLGLNNLNNLKLNHNRLKTYENIKGIKAVQKSLTYLDLSANESLDYDNKIYEALLSQFNKVAVLSLSGTLIPKQVPSYRKETIVTMPSLMFLDERPVTADERRLAQAWKKGGLLLEKEVRGQIREKLVDKNNKIYAEIQERNAVVQEKRKRVFEKLTTRQTIKLKDLYNKKNSQDYELMRETQKNILNLQIQELQKYLEHMRQNVKDLDLEKELNEGKVDLPSMLIEKETSEVIFLYNVSQQQLPLVIEKYYPTETRPVIAAKTLSPSETRWIKEYDQLLHSTYQQVRGDLDLLVPVFNLGLYELDSELQRRVKRFELQELKYHLGSIKEEEERRQKQIDSLNELD